MFTGLCNHHHCQIPEHFITLRRTPPPTSSRSQSLLLQTPLHCPGYRLPVVPTRARAEPWGLGWNAGGEGPWHWRRHL